MSWQILSDESVKKKREKKRKRKIKRGSKRGRYVVLGSRGRSGRKSSIHCITCGNTLSPNASGDICHVCASSAEKKVKNLNIPQMTPQFLGGQTIEKKTQLTIPKMTGEK